MAKSLQILCGLCILSQAAAQTNRPANTSSDASGVTLAASRQFAAILTFPYGQSRLLSEKQHYYTGNSTFYQYIEAFPPTLLSPYDSAYCAWEANCFETLDWLASTGSPQQQKLAENVGDLIIRNMRLNLGDYAHGGGGLTVGMALSVLGSAWNAAGSLQNSLERGLGPAMAPMGTASRQQTTPDFSQPGTAESVGNYDAAIDEAAKTMAERGNYSVVVSLARDQIYAEAGSIWEHSLIPTLTAGAGPKIQDKLVTFGYAGIVGKDEKTHAIAAFGNPSTTLHKVVVRVRMHTPANENLDWYGWFPAVEPKNYVVILVPQFLMLAGGLFTGDFTLWCDEGTNIELPFDRKSAPELDRAYNQFTPVGGSFSEHMLESSKKPEVQAQLARNKKAAKFLDLMIQKEVEFEPRPSVGRRKLTDTLGKGQLYTGQVKGTANGEDSLIPMSIRCEPFETKSQSIQVTLLSGQATSFQIKKLKGYFQPRINYGSVIAFNDPSAAQLPATDNKGPFFAINCDGELIYKTPYGKFPFKPVEAKPTTTRASIGVTNAWAK